ncbi:MAG: hypothetical protein A2017_08080 [Lentisphaerae bacterium GWF2_44_16]|nr:MAG: hypothetical protein A2017_08080 [Lentisphaerae bacterium GWF2_44_16]
MGKAINFLLLTFLISFNQSPVNAQNADSAVLAGSSVPPLKQALVADFEADTQFKAFPLGKASAKIVSTTASSGSKSIRFEFDADGKTSASLVLPFTGNMSEYDSIAFNYYCENDNGTMCTVTVHGKDSKEASDHLAKLRIADARDGWMPARFARGKTLRFRGKANVKDDWSDITGVSFSFNKEMKGKLVFYIDNVRFEKTSAASARNLLYNSSYEITSTIDVPDGWRRDFDRPPFGKDIWGIDESNAWHGKKSLRIGLNGKEAHCWTRNLRLVKDHEYTFSIYMKSDKPGTKADIIISAFPKPGHSEVIVDKEWKRYTISGKVQAQRTSIIVKLLSDSVLWLDAAQFEEGCIANAYNCPDALKDNVGKKTAEKISKASFVKKSVIKPAGKSPVLDGLLDEKCWADAVEMKDFVKVDVNESFPEKTVAKMTYDTEAIYIAVKAECKDTEALKENIGKVKNPWASDNVEIFMDFNNEGNSYYHFVSNAAGHKYGARYNYIASSKTKKGILWYGDWQSAGRVNRDNWTLEVRIPYTYLDLNSTFNPDRKIAVNICRTIPDEKGGKPSCSSWSFSDNGFHKLPNFGEIEGFDFSLLSPYKINVSDIGWDNDKAEAELKNLSGKDVELNVKFFTETAKDKLETEIVKIKIPEKGNVKASAPMKLDKDGFYKISLKGEDASGKTRVISQPVDIKITGANKIKFSGTEFDFYTRETTARARLIIEMKEKELQGLLARITLSDLSGSDVFNKDFKVSNGVNDYELDISGLKEGFFTVKFSLHDSNGKEISSGASSFRKLKPAGREVRINRWGRFLIVDGKPFMSYGFFDNSIAKKASLDIWRSVLQDMAKANCNTVLGYAGLRTDLNNALKEYLDEADKQGIKVWVHLEGMLTYFLPKAQGVNDRFKNADDAEKAMREIVAKYKDHPALLGWCTYDEPGNRPNVFTSEVVYNSYKLVKELDPYHPCILSHVTHMRESDIYGKATDMALIPYIARGGRYDHLFNELWEFGLPLMVNPPCYGAASSRDREPTAGEQRIAVYKAVIMGARGICFYTYRCASERTWSEMAKMGAELKSFTEILCDTSMPLKLRIIAQNDDVLALVKKHGGENYLFIVNTAPEKVDAGFSCQDIGKIKNIKRLCGSGGASYEKETGKLKISLDKQSSAVYEIENY